MLNNNLKSNENNNTIKGEDNNMNNLQDLTKLINGVSAFLKEVQGVTSLEEQAVNQLAKVLADNLGLAKEIETVKVEIKEVEKEIIPTEVQEELALLKDDNEKLNNQIKSLEPKIVEDTTKINELQNKITEQESIIEQLAECLETSNTVIEQQKAELEEATRIMQFALTEINELNKLQNEEPSDNEIADFEDEDESEIDNIQDDLEQQSDELDNGNNDEDMVHSDSNSEEIDTDDDILDFIMETESKPVEELSFDDQPEEPVQKPKKLKRNTGFKSNGFEPAVYINEDTSDNDAIFEKQLSYMNIIEEDTCNDDALFEKQLSHMNIETETYLDSSNVQEAKLRKTTRKQSQYDQYGNPRESRKISSETPNDTTTAMNYLKRVKSNEINFEYVLANRKEFEDMCTLWLSINMNQLPMEISNLKVELFKYDLENTNLED